MPWWRPPAEGAPAQEWEAIAICRPPPCVTRSGRTRTRSFGPGGVELDEARHELLAGGRREIEVGLGHIRCFGGPYYEDPRRREGH
jgi:hypothetical protein